MRRLHDPTLDVALADQRELAMATYRIEMTAARKEGREEGRAKGRAEGRAEGLRIAVADLCEAFGIELDADRTATLQALDAQELEALRAEIKATKRWPASR